MPAGRLAVLLAAGAGTRLRPLTDTRPKCLLEVGGRPLLDYQLEALMQYGIQDVLVVTGHAAEQIVRRYGKRVRTLHDPDYATTNNLHSFWAAREEFAGRDLLCLHADLLFHPDILRPCFESDADVCVVLDRALVEETMKARVENERVVEIGKNIPADRAFGTFLGIARFAPSASARLPVVLDALVREEKNRNAYFTSCLPALAAEGHRVAYTLTARLPWIEIDVEEDLERAHKRVLPQVASSYGKMEREPDVFN